MEYELSDYRGGKLHRKVLKNISLPNTHWLRIIESQDGSFYNDPFRLLIEAMSRSDVEEVKRMMKL